MCSIAQNLVSAIVLIVAIASGATSIDAKTALRANSEISVDRVGAIATQPAKTHQQIGFGYGWTASDSTLAAEAGAKVAPELSTAAQRSIRSIEGRLAEHETKLAAYKENPFKFDNRGDLARNAARPEVQQRIIEGRTRHLEGEIRNFQQQLERLLSGSVEP